MHVRAYLFVVAIGLAACGKSDSNTPPDGGGDDVDAPLADAANPVATFAYKPGWDGAITVEVVGARVGTTGTWPVLATLSKGGDGTFTGSAQLAPGNYDYVVHVIGDADAGAKSDTFERYAIDPSNAAFEACPADSPTSGNEANPCSILTVPQGAAQAQFHVTGKVTTDNTPAAGFLVLVERQEPQSHHFFANRVTTAADGTYDLPVAAGAYRIQVQHPQFESKTDAQLDPTTLDVFRRNLTSSFSVTADVAVTDSAMAFHDYALFAPVDAAVLPTAFTYSTTPSKLQVYGTGNEIGDPWFNGKVDSTGTATFDGKFNTDKAKTDNVVLGTKYFWGIEQPKPADSGGFQWTSQTLAFPITWASPT